MLRRTIGGALALACALCACRLPAEDAQPAPQPQAPPQPAEAQPPPPTEAQLALAKALSAYTGAKTYQASWTFTQERPGQSSKMALDVKTKGAARAYFRMGPADPKAAKSASQEIPAALIVADGKTVYFESTSDKVFFKAPLPKNPQGSAVIFFPIVLTSDGYKMSTEDRAGTSVLVLEADIDQGTLRMEIDAATHHIRRMVEEQTIGLIKTVSTLTVDKEQFDADIPDSAFSYKAPRGAKEIPAPPGSTAIFGPQDR